MSWACTGTGFMSEIGSHNLTLSRQLAVFQLFQGIQQNAWKILKQNYYFSDSNLLYFFFSPPWFGPPNTPKSIRQPPIQDGEGYDMKPSASQDSVTYRGHPWLLSAKVIDRRERLHALPSSLHPSHSESSSILLSWTEGCSTIRIPTQWSPDEWTDTFLLCH